MIPASIATAVETFDGSSIVDPVVVSNVFWAGLKAKLIAFIFGQILAAAVFSIILSVAASQFTKSLDSLLSSFGSESPKPPLKIPREINGDQRPIRVDATKLAICLLIDVIGTSSELLPVVGEVSDIAWAPVAAWLLRGLYGNAVGVLELVEEILPFTDVLPLATLCFVIDTFFADSELARVLRIGTFSDKIDNDSVDVRTINMPQLNKADRAKE